MNKQHRGSTFGGKLVSNLGDYDDDDDDDDDAIYLSKFGHLLSLALSLALTCSLGRSSGNRKREKEKRKKKTPLQKNQKNKPSRV